MTSKKVPREMSVQLLDLAHSISSERVVNDFCVVPHVDASSMGIVSGGADGLLKLSVVRNLCVLFLILSGLAWLLGFFFFFFCSLHFSFFRRISAFGFLFEKDSAERLFFIVCRK